MISMKMTAEEAKDGDLCCDADSGAKGPAYPYGLTIYLDDKTLAKLGITELPDVGTKMALRAVVEVTSNSQRQTQEGKTVNMDLQITDMELSTAVEKSSAQRAYPGMNP
jgi:hypothetical protein